MQKKLKVLSLFSGCGGMDLGFEGGFNVLSRALNPVVNPNWTTSKLDNTWSYLEETIFKTIFANDIRPDAKRAWIKYFSKKGLSPDIYHLESIVDLVKKYKTGIKEIFPSDVDVVTGGFPCQDFSVAGNRQGLNSKKSHNGEISDIDEPSEESRGQLYMWMREVISVTKPKVFIAENVKGLVNLGDVKEIIENDFRNIGENGFIVIPAKVLHSAEYGVPQSRERVIFYGFNKDYLTNEAIAALTLESIPEQFDPYPLKTHYLPNTQPNNSSLAPFVTTQEAFTGLQEPDETLDMAQKKYSKAKFMGAHCQGQNEVNLNGIAPTIRSEHHGNIEFRRLSEENGGVYLEELKAGLLPRRLTVRECARIQTFPDDYEFVWDKNKELEIEGLSASSAYKIIGNAVPPLLGYHIAKRLESNWHLYFN
ncbi:DNA (cytosine-5-)-methyltransferase [uncultured Psychrobacillus sp.]|uniref:DNA cytosine methyltransferase n=1 Tax=uncultured Psychrobacillus sp. TaxID=1551585 RepID=UPI00262BA564|nr:DNA (cytosine-5-)-methyltransferase [uncultured Psychrobacillus sp.]